MRQGGFACHPCNGAVVGVVGFLAATLQPAQWALKAGDLPSLPMPVLVLVGAGAVAWFLAGIAIWEMVLFAGLGALAAAWALSWASEAWLGATPVQGLYVYLGAMAAIGAGIPAVMFVRERMGRG
jgi:hypothetical protein